jgi:hypothetical protein
MHSEIEFTLPGESLIANILVVVTLAIVLFFFMGIALGGKLSGILVFIGIVVVIYLYIRVKWINKVTFRESDIVVKYYLNTSAKLIHYESVVKLHYSKIYSQPTHIYVITYTVEDKTKKVYFYCTKTDYVNRIEPFLNGKGLITTERWKKYR